MVSEFGASSPEGILVTFLASRTPILSISLFFLAAQHAGTGIIRVVVRDDGECPDGQVH